MIEIKRVSELTEREKMHKMLDLYLDVAEWTDDYLALNFSNYAFNNSFYAMKGPFNSKKEHSAFLHEKPDEAIEYLENLLKEKESQEAGTSEDSGN